ncbi:glycosyltransferase [Flavobacterium sp. SUN052]|uniref:glycosyltransferase n=1 Tax=Flavobacterium sp. SUN052 TaxID=3002441 RepID=UPI00237DEEEC|nr:glycosyltransferase [Flavobacterium sp. SUN052]MEC4004416.1 glycosyltransferase [Flavobacterium sp. SUN052]
MKVLHIINSLQTGGAEKLIVDSVPIYQSKGIDTDVILLKKSTTDFYTKLENTSTGKLFSLSTGSVYSPLLIFKIIPFLKNYDLVHVHLFPSSYWVVLAKMLSFSKIKIIYTEHSTNNRRRENKFFQIIDKIIYKYFEDIICITQGAKEKLEQHIGTNYPISVINNGIVVKDFYQTKTKEIQKNSTKKEFTLIQVSSFRGAKDQATVIKSLTHLEDKVKLVLVGTGQKIEDCKKLVSELNLQNRVSFLGNRYDIPYLLANSDVVILSSNFEGFGLSIVEGMAANKPCIASDIEGIREIVSGFGLLFEKGNSKHLSEIILELYQNQEFYTKIANQCFTRANDFDIEKMVDDYIKIYNNRT